MKPKPKKKFTAKELKQVAMKALSEYCNAIVRLGDGDIVVVKAITRYINRKLK